MIGEQALKTSNQSNLMIQPPQLQQPELMNPT